MIPSLVFLITGLLGVAAYFAGVVRGRRDIELALQVQRDGFFNALMSYRLGEGRSAQVCVPVAVLEAWRKRTTVEQERRSV